VAFCYFLVIPGMASSSRPLRPRRSPRRPTSRQYFGFVLTLFLVFGIAFEVPIAVIVLARMGVVSIEQLKKVRGYFIVGAFIVAAIVTPPDVVSQLALAIPMMPAVRGRHHGPRSLFIKHTKAPDDQADCRQAVGLSCTDQATFEGRVPRPKKGLPPWGVASVSELGGPTSPRY
jgi:sec-independent protein translocase protein TatC